MPKMSGLELAQRLREGGLGVDLNVVYMSGYSREMVDARPLRTDGSEAFLEKPYTMHELLDRVAALIQ
jgi:CheY-like chemotaxis protein